jgi:hypothetical protein
MGAAMGGLRSARVWTVALVALATATARAADEPDCAARFAQTSATLAEVERDYVARVYARTLFASGTANAAAERVLRPLLERAMQLASADPPSLALECRTWACRIRVLHGARLDAAAWERALAGASLAGRIHSIAVVGRRPTTDALDGEDLVEATVYFKLTDPSGEQLAASSTDMAFVRGPDCATQLAGLEKRLAAMKRIIERDASPAERFARERPDPQATRDLEARLRRATAELPAPFAGLAVACRGVICQVQPRAGVRLGRPEWQKLERHPELAAVVVGRAYQGAAYWLVRPSRTADGRVVLDQLVAELEAGPLLTSCRKRHPAAGHLLVSYVLAGRDPLGRPAAKGGLTTICTGSLAETPLGRCVADEIARALATAALPADVLNYTKNRRYDFDAGSDRVAVRAR